MQKIKRILSTVFKFIIALTSCYLAYASLFIIGNAQEIIPYVDWGPLPTIKLGYLLFGILLSIALSYYYLIVSALRAVNNDQNGRIVLLFGICFLAAFLAAMSGQMFIYIGVGEYLRDVHGVNWFFMDWGQWGYTQISVTTPILAAIIYYLVDRKLK